MECLDSLFNVESDDFNIVIVDNGSTNDSVDKIIEFCKWRMGTTSSFFKNNHFAEPIPPLIITREQIMRKGVYPPSVIYSQILVIKNERNYGFAEGNNIGFVAAKKFFDPNYVLMLNSDVRVDRRFLIELLNAGKLDPKFGILGPKIYYNNYLGRSDVINFAGEDIVLRKGKGLRYGFRELDRGQYDKIRKVDKIDGACMLIKTQVFQEIGCLDPEFFAFWEETDFCIRAKKAGWITLYVPKSVIWHKISSSLGGIFASKKVYLNCRNRFLFVRRNVNGSDRLLFLGYFVCWDFWFYTGQLIKYRQLKAIRPFFQGALDGFILFLRAKAK